MAIKAVSAAAICLGCNDILLLQVVGACPLRSVLLGIIALKEINWRERKKQQGGRAPVGGGRPRQDIKD